MKTILALLLSVASLQAATYYVSTAGSNTNPGNESHPFLTIQKAVDVAQPGDTILVGAGTFNEFVVSKRHGNGDNRIVLDGQNIATFNRLTLDHSHHTIQNFGISGNDASRKIFIKRGAHYTTITNNFLNANMVVGVDGIEWQNPTTKPFGTDDASHCLIISNRITGVLGTTVIGVKGSFNRIIGNYVYDVSQADFIRLQGMSNIIAGNIFTNNFSTPGIGNHMDFIQALSDGGFGSKHHIIANNWVHQIKGGQLSQVSDDGNIVEEIGNWIWVGNVFMDIRDQASISVPNMKFYANTFVRCNYSGGSALSINQRTFTSSPGVISHIAYSHNTQVLGNVFYACGDGSANSGTYAWTNESLTNGVAEFSYVGNAAFESKRLGTKSIADGPPYEDFRWFEYFGINGGDPLFTNIGADDYRPLEGSPLIGSGTNLTALVPEEFRVDINGNPRPDGAWTIGAFEYDGEAPAPVAPSFTSHPQSRTVLAGADVIFSAAVTGTQPITFQWSKGGVEIDGETSASLSLSSVDGDDAGSYYVVATNSAGSQQSNPATLTVNSEAPPPVEAPRQQRIKFNGTIILVPGI